jgi:hypothetical protein
MCRSERFSRSLRTNTGERDASADSRYCESAGRIGGVLMAIRFSRHAKRRMKWRSISEDEIKAVVKKPDVVEPSVKGRKNARKIVSDRVLQVTYIEEDGDFIIVTAIDLTR